MGPKPRWLIVVWLVLIKPFQDLVLLKKLVKPSVLIVF